MGQYSGVYTARQQMQASTDGTWPLGTFQYLVVAGGGGGGSDAGGGGGAGGYRTATVPIEMGTTYTITVGAGGAGGTGGSNPSHPTNAAVNGSNSSLIGASLSITSLGGGYGGMGQYEQRGGGTGAGGSGGGGGGSYPSSGAGGPAGLGTAGQGNNGAAGLNLNETGGGGGGAGAAATNQNGGAGLDWLSLGTYYAGGGGGAGWESSAYNDGAGGIGGGGKGGSYPGKSTAAGTAGTTNTGGGGGGGNQANGAAGGSGVVIIRTSQTATRTSGSPTVTTSGGLNTYTFTGSGTITFGGSTLGTQSNPAANVAALRAAGITTDGDYYFTMGGNTFRSYVRFNYIDGGDWYLILKVHNQGDMPSGSAYWQNSTLYNENDFNLTSGTWSKYASWLYVPFTRVMMGMTQGGSLKVPPIMIWNAQKTSFYNVISGITVSNGSGDRCDSTSPSISTNATYWNMSMASGTAFTDAGGQEDIVQHYGIGCFNNNASNSTTAEGFASVGRAGAWVGCPLDEGGHTFNNVGNSGSDSGFGFGASAGNPAKTTSCGYNEWTNSSSTNTLPAYLWVR